MIRLNSRLRPAPATIRRCWTAIRANATVAASALAAAGRPGWAVGITAGVAVLDVIVDSLPTDQRPDGRAAGDPAQRR
jgi:hypothetical protein